MKKYVIYAPKLGYYQASKNHVYREQNFVDAIEDAYWYATERSVLKASLGMSKFDAEIHTIDVSVKLLSEQSTLAGEMLDRNRKMVDELNDMSSDEVELLSESKWQQYKKARRYVREYG